MKKITEAEVEDRISRYWNDIKNIVRTSNTVNHENPIYEYTSPLITNYFLWRILSELKLLNSNSKVQND